MVWDLAAVLVVVAGLVVAIVAGRRGQELLGFVLCGITGLLVSPISWTHHWVYVLPALALVVPGAPGATWLRHTWSRVAFGVVLIGLFTAWPARIGPYGGWDPKIPWSDPGLLRYVAHGTPRIENHWSLTQLVLGDYYVLVGLLFIAVAAVHLWLTRERPALESTVPAQRAVSAQGVPS